jgi:DMSO/TMAO reductase YedYZ molybdopterin-dependent catalytic subunit
MSRIFAAIVSLIAASAAMWVQSLARAMWQIRSLPERVMEWSLLFVPLDLFERGIQQFGPDAKELALVGNVLGMAISLTLIGYVLLRRRASGGVILGVSVALWLLAMLVIMPITGGGVFGTALFQSPLLVSVAYLSVFLIYAVVLLLGVSVWQSIDSVRVAGYSSSRRELGIAAVGAVGTWFGALWLGRSGGSITSELPLAQVASPPTQQPVLATDATTIAAAPAIAPTTVPTLEPLPVPAPARKLERDKDGALTAAQRPKGTLPEPITTNEQFYVVTKNAVADPVVDPESWRLIVDGEVQRPVQIDYRTLRQLPSVETAKTIECISNFTAMCELTSFGCDLISTARWKGVRLSDIIDLAGGLKSSAAYLSVVSVDEFSSGLPLEIIKDPDTIVVYEMNGDVLPREHGYPARLLVPGRYGMKNPKWLAVIRPVREEFLGWYEQRNWNKDGIVKTMARIDVPAGGASLAAGPQRIAGVAYAGDRGIRTVELSSDEGKTWLPASFLEPAAGKDAWVRWELMIDLPAGSTIPLVVRATDGNGEVQTEEFKLPQPDGGSGRHQIDVKTV